jgi:hypothetical protein
LKYLLPVLSILLLFTAVSHVNGQTDSLYVSGKSSFSLSLHTGFIISHRPALVHLQKRHIRMAEVQYLKSANGDKTWHRIYNYPLYGLGYKYIDFGNDKELGRGHSLYSQLLLPLSKHHRYSVNMRFGIGIGYVEKPFHYETNYKNLAIGTKLNGTVLTGFQFRMFTKKKIHLFGGIDFFHFSNGAFKLPNLGLNLATINFGATYYTGDPIVTKIPAKEKLKRKHEFNSAVAIGFKERYPPEGPNFMVNIINFQYHLPWGQKGLLGAGSEMIIDQSLRGRLEEDSIQSSYLEGSTRIGVFGSCGLQLGKWDAVLQPGVYLYSKLSEDGFIYNRLLLKYRFHQHFYASLGLKSHFAKADYFEWGIGVRI